MRKPSVLVIHNHYQQSGGEDAVVHAEIELLRRAGHRVLTYMRANTELRSYSLVRKASLLLSTSWNQRTCSELRDLIARDRPDIAHFHNFLPLISPAAHRLCRSVGIPVVQTLHNYRLLCPAATLFRDGRPCHDCSPHLAPALRRGCYRNSRWQTAAVSLMLAGHRRWKTWDSSVDAYLTPSRFCREYFAGAGLPAAKVRYKPNFLACDPGLATRPGAYALFVGRLSPEKGVLEMIRSWETLRGIPLLIAGDGPLYAEAHRLVQTLDAPIKLLGRLNSGKILNCIKQARFLIFPSLWYEPFGMGLLEASACGVPAIASRIGAIPELVADRSTGLLFNPQNFDQLTERVSWAWTHQRAIADMGRNARHMFLSRFTPERNYEQLAGIYQQLLNG